jgi:hypothetical protein
MISLVERRNLSPGFPSPIEHVEVMLPGGAWVANDTSSR